MAPPLLEFLERHGGSLQLSGLRALVPGCGSGHEARYLATQGLLVTGLDLSPDALASAARWPAPHPIHWLCGDFLLPGTWLGQPFDYLIEHTCLCSMPPHLWPAYAASARHVLVPGGSFVGIFYIQTRDPGGPPYQIDPGQIDALFGTGWQLRDRFRPTRSFPSRVGREEVRWYQKCP